MSPEKGSFGILQSIVGSWYESLKSPQKSQERVLSELVSEYGKTRYGKDHNASEIEGVAGFRDNFPTIDYSGLNPYLTEVQTGDYSAILPEPLVCWVMTRGSTGPAKVLPATRTHLNQIFTCGARALVNHVLRKEMLNFLKEMSLTSIFHRPFTRRSRTDKR